MEDVKDVAVETEEIVNDGKVSMDIEDSETSEDSSAEETEGQDESGKDEKTSSEDVLSKEDPDDKVVDDGRPIPYERFKSVIDKKNSIKTEFETLKAENEEIGEILNNPIVFKAVLQAKGITDPKILADKMREAGFESKDEVPKKELFKQLSQGLDLTTQDGWFEMMERIFQHYSKSALEPIEKKLNEKETQSYIIAQETEAKKISKDVYGIEYGESGKDEKNPNTAVGKMSAYLSKHPEDARLGHVKILRLALAEEGVKLGEKKGITKEKERNTRLKVSAMEDDGQVVKDGTPNASWSVSEIMAYRRKHGK